MDIKKRTPFLLTIIGIPIFFITVLQAKDQSSPSPKISSAVESFGIQRFEEKRDSIPFFLKDLNGNQVSLSNYKGKPVLLFFWAAWCIACKEDIVLLEKFSEGKRDRLEILTVAIDGEKEARVKSVVKKNKITLPVLLDIKERTARKYGVRMVPSAFIINREGRMEGMIVGQREWSESTAEAALRELLNLH
jgi:peroxiredoxin